METFLEKADRLASSAQIVARGGGRRADWARAWLRAYDGQPWTRGCSKTGYQAGQYFRDRRLSLLNNLEQP